MAVHSLAPSTGSPSLLDRAPITREITVAEALESQPTNPSQTSPVSRESNTSANAQPSLFPSSRPTSYIHPPSSAS